ncbi:hypothetical protein NE237_029750 [Protea cynaroides]|uniref:Uncharacterized protein n=1 Tax=Protea cynaroides TaxID=273540 RepID=A0A9Q0GSE2_9MAGN|nr:hypothetical protein NE237_029750 [Protea cynaroides]
MTYVEYAGFYGALYHCIKFEISILDCVSVGKGGKCRSLWFLQFRELLVIIYQECISMVSRLDKELIGPPRNLNLVTWIAEQLLSIAVENSNSRHPELEIMSL